MPSAHNTTRTIVEKCVCVCSFFRAYTNESHKNHLPVQGICALNRWRSPTLVLSSYFAIFFCTIFSRNFFSVRIHLNFWMLLLFWYILSKQLQQFRVLIRIYLLHEIGPWHSKCTISSIKIQTKIHFWQFRCISPDNCIIKPFTWNDAI